MRMRTHRLLQRSTVLAAAALAGVVPAAGAATVAWTDCGDGLQCATVPVPLDHARPSGPTISIALIRFPASDQANRIGSLFINPGGPGGSGVQTVRLSGAGLDQIYGGRFDIVGFDPRGVGASTSVRCFTGEVEQALFLVNETRVPDGPAAVWRAVVKSGVFTGRCGARAGELLRHLSTEDTARDLDLLRAAVGDVQLSYLGLSYGTALGATYANLFPDRVRALVLDGVTDPVTYSTDLFAWTAGSLRDTERVLAGFARGCAAAGPQRCALAGRGDVRARIETLLTRLRRAPIPAPTAPVPGVLDYSITRQLLFGGLYTPDLWPQLAAGLAAAEAGDGSPLLQAASAQPPTQPPGGPSDYDNTLDAQAGILCTDSPAPRDPARWPGYVRRLQRISPTGAETVGWGNELPCASWPAEAANRYTGPWNARTSHPVLLVGVTADPITPLASARRLARLMGPSAVLLTHDGFGHTSFGQFSSCTIGAVTAYLVDGTTPAAGTVCRADEPLFPAAATRAAGSAVPYPATLPQLQR